jgi:hypothetical protein
MKTTFNQHIGVFEDAIPFNICDNIISTFETNPDKTFTRLEAESASSIHKKDRFLVGNVLDNELIQLIHSKISTIFLKAYNDKYSFTGDINTSPYIFKDFKVQKTLPTEGYHVWHYEGGVPPHLDRFAVWSIFLNDVEEGGETEFLHQSLRVKPKKGTLCIFPANFTHLHRGNPPLSGKKYLATGWINWNPGTL